jgi:transposase-like protein
VGCPRCGSKQWTVHDLRVRRLRAFDGEHVVEHRRWKCIWCRKVVTSFDARVVPRFLYSRAVIASALTSRLAGASCEQTAFMCY